jgi:hypothetical protein
VLRLETSSAVSRSESGDRLMVWALRCPAPQPGRRSYSSGRGTENEQRHSLRPFGQVLEECEQRLVGPVQVVEHEHARACGGQTFEEAPPGREELLPLGRRSRFDADEWRQPL